MQKILTFYQQKVTIFADVVGIYLASWGLNEDVKLNDDVKLTKFWTTGPCIHVLFSAVRGDLPEKWLGFAKFSAPFYGHQRWLGGCTAVPL